MKMARVVNRRPHQVIELPEDVRLKSTDLIVVQHDDTLLLYPRRAGWDLMHHGINTFTPDYMQSRNQPPETQPVPTPD